MSLKVLSNSIHRIQEVTPGTRGELLAYGYGRGVVVISPDYYHHG